MSLSQALSEHYETIMDKLHEVIHDEYKLEVLLDDSDAKGVGETDKIIDIWSNIIPTDLYSGAAIKHICDIYTKDRIFRERWTSVAMRIQFWLGLRFNIEASEITKAVISQIKAESNMTGRYVPTAIYAARVESMDADIHELSVPEMFWYTCFVIARLTMDKSVLINERLSIMNESRSMSASLKRPRRQGAVAPSNQEAKTS